ncbi:MAG: hypothetical protein WCE27_18510, partial [Pseudolabrys sp.]
MARTKPKLSFAAAGGKPRLKISSADWQRIESAYERSLPNSVRRKIRAVTHTFLDWVVFEHTVRP